MPQNFHAITQDNHYHARIDHFLIITKNHEEKYSARKQPWCSKRLNALEPILTSEMLIQDCHQNMIEFGVTNAMMLMMSKTNVCINESWIK